MLMCQCLSPSSKLMYRSPGLAVSWSRRTVRVVAISMLLVKEWKAVLTRRRRTCQSYIASSGALSTHRRSRAIIGVMLQIWGRISSINVRKVVWCAQELGLAFRRTDAGRHFGVVETTAYRALNPNGLVPTIEDDDDTGQRFQLWESNVIVRYLCARHASGRLYPESLRARFDAERWMDWQQTTLNPAGREAFVQW